MKVTFALATALVLTACVATPLAAADKTAAVEKEISKIEHELAAACLKNDVAVFDRYYAPEWVWTVPDGSVQTRAQNLELWRKGAIKVSAFKVDDVQVKVYGNTAIAFFMDTETTNFDGRDVSGQYRSTDVFVKRDGKWMMVATHSCRVAK